MPAPTVVVYKDAYAGRSSPVALTQRTVATGDAVAFIAHTADYAAGHVTAVAKTAGTATIGTVTSQQEAGSANECSCTLWTFPVTTGGTITLTVTGTGTSPMGACTFWTYVATGSGGTGNTGKTTSSTTTIVTSLTTSASSYVISSAADWAAVGGAATTLTPAGFTLDAHECDGVVDQVASGTQFSSRGGHWPSVSAGTVSYGATVPTSAKYVQVVCELLAPAGGPRPSLVQDLPQAISRAALW